MPSLIGVPLIRPSPHAVSYMPHIAVCKSDIVVIFSLLSLGFTYVQKKQWPCSRTIQGDYGHLISSDHGDSKSDWPRIELHIGT